MTVSLMYHLVLFLALYPTRQCVAEPSLHLQLRSRLERNLRHPWEISCACDDITFTACSWEIDTQSTLFFHMGHQAVECKSSLRMFIAVPCRPRCRQIDASVLAVATSKCFRLPRLFRRVSAGGGQREGPRIIRMFDPQGRDFGHRNQCDLHRVMPTAMPSLNAEKLEGDDFHAEK
jgi:hypothetical protein